MTLGPGVQGEAQAQQLLVAVTGQEASPAVEVPAIDQSSVVEQLGGGRAGAGGGRFIGAGMLML